MTMRLTSAKTNLEWVQELYTAFARDDVAAVLGRLDPAVEWIEAAGFPYGGTYRSPQAVLEGVFMRLGNEWDSFTVSPDACYDAGDTIVVYGWYSGVYQATGKAFRARFAHVWTLRDGNVTRFEQVADTAQVHAALTT